MVNFFLYFVTVMIWGSTWLAIQFQLGVVSPVWSLIYRFSLAVILLWVYTKITRLNLRYTRRQHFLMLSQGLLLFALSYLLFYIGSTYFISGLVSILFASIIFMNIFNARIFLQTPLSIKIFVSALLGIAGLCLVFSSQFEALQKITSHDFFLGFSGCLLGTFLASVGNIVSAIAQREHIPVIQNNLYSMFYAVIILIIIAAIMGQKPAFDFSLKYWLSLLYLAVFGSLLAFGAYLKLLGRIGPSRASYAFVILPIVSLAISTIYESFTWTQVTLLGVALVVLGNLLVLLPKKEIAASLQERKQNKNSAIEIN